MEQISNRSPWRTPCQSRWMCPQGSCSPWRAQAGPSLLAGAVDVERNTCMSRFSGRICGPWGTQVGEVHRERSTRGEVLRTDHKSYFPPPPCCSRWGKEVEELGVRLGLGRRRGGRRGEGGFGLKQDQVIFLTILLCY